jgi:hypothetical protein
MINLPYYRKMFEENNIGRKSILQTRWQPCDVHSNVVRVAIHIRRGDLIDYLRAKSSAELRSEATEQRLVDENAYGIVLHQLLNKFEGFGVRHIEVRLYCEGMDAPAKVPSAVSWELVDFQELVMMNNSIQNVSISPGSSDSIEAFDEMCFSDILITGTSGFSHMASILCKTPIILAMPFWLSYDNIPNAMTLDVSRKSMEVRSVAVARASIIHSASFNETKFDTLWHERCV